jgi:hypothetical protein
MQNIRPQAVKKRQEAPQRAEECAQEETVAGIQFGVYTVEPAAGAAKAVEEAPGLEKWLRPKTSALK